MVIKKSQNLDLIQMAREMDGKDLSDLAVLADYAKLLKIEQLQVSDTVEPLRKQAEAFHRCIAEGAPPVVSARDALAALRCAETIVEAIKSHRWDGPTSERMGLDIINRDS